MGETLPTKTRNPMTLIEAALENEADPERLRQIMDLAREWRDDQAREAFNRAMHDAQNAMPTVVKSARNAHTNSKYPKMEDVQQVAKPILSRHGLAVSFSEGEPSREGWCRVIARVRHVDGHTETYERHGPMDDKGPKGGAVKSELHGVASTVSYLSRKLFMGIFNITEADEDNDGNTRQPFAVMTDAQAEELKRLYDKLDEDAQAKCLAWIKKGSPTIEGITDVPGNRYREIRDKLAVKVGQSE